MRRLVLLIFVAALSALPFSMPGPAHASGINVGSVIWQFSRDYPGADGNDLNLPIKTVYIKTHDGTDWMSTYDSHPRAVSGPDALRSLIRDYSYQGIDVIAWFVPYGTDIEGQLQSAREVIDAGVNGLVADVEPYSGFCNQDCAMLAEHFWKPLRAQRPNAFLGVTYDPRSWWLGPAAIQSWLSVSDMAAPECYWETFAGQGIWGDPGGCVMQSYTDLKTMTPGRNVEFAPMLQGNASPSGVRYALDTALSLGANRASLWRRGVVPAEVWSEIKTYIGEPNRPCWVMRSDSCLIRDSDVPDVYVLQGGAAFGIAGPEVLLGMGYNWSDVNVVPPGYTALVPEMPRDGTVLREFGTEAVHVVWGGGRSTIPGVEFSSLGQAAAAVRTIPAGGLEQVTPHPIDDVPPCWVTLGDNCLVRDSDVPDVYVLQGGAAFGITGPEILLGMGYDWGDVNVVPPGYTALVPEMPRDGTVLRESGVAATSVIYAGARFAIPDGVALEAIGLDPAAVREIPPGGLAQIGAVPRDYNRFREADADEFVVYAGRRVRFESPMLESLQRLGGGNVYTLWPGALAAYPEFVPVPGDASCSGSVDAVDALHLLMEAGDIPHDGICAATAGDLDCDADGDVWDALILLRSIAGLPVTPNQGCPGLAAP